jgi:biofilm PGA synthesis N-glycosyltransferase PgaC
MLNEWLHWISSLHADQLFWVLVPVLLFDAPRYAAGCTLVWCWDFVVDMGRSIRGTAASRFDHCPSVCVVIAGLNEAATVQATLSSVWGTYPRLEILVVDDGSTDGMADAAQQFADGHRGVLVLRRPRRGGKSSALNLALPFTRAEIIVCVDSDSHLAPNALWEIVQPFADPRVGAVSAAVLGRNPFHNLVTWLQAMEYLRSIFIGRMFAHRMDILGIVSGALGAYRREAIQRVGGWDVGPGEDGDLTLRLRKSGYSVAYAPYAQCLTNLPTAWSRLLKQRRRWEWALVTFECRKHIDLADPRQASFRMSNLWMLADRWLFNGLLQFVFWSYLAWLCLHAHEHTWKLFLLYYLIYLGLELVQLGIILYYSNQRWRDLLIGLATPLMPVYHVVLRGVMFLAVIEEALSRQSYRDGFVPPHVRQSTWHW